MESREKDNGIPDDVLGEIFLRYSAWSTKPLAELQCVCKSWRALITDPCFARLHRKLLVQHKETIRQAMHQNNNNSSLVAYGYDPLSSLVAYGYDPRLPWSVPIVRSGIFGTTLSSLSDFDPHQRDFALDVHLEQRYFLVQGSCDGLLLLVSDLNFEFNNNNKLFRIWNPATGDFTSIPSPSFRDNLYTMYGFGHALNSNDYKVVAIKRCPRIEVEIFSMRSGMWRTLQGLTNTYHTMFAGCKPFMFDGNFASGAVQWLGNSPSNELIIIAFDLGREEFKEIQLPVLTRKLSVRMSVKGENICLLVGDQEAHSYNIYVMTKYGVRESWCKIYTIPDPPKMDKFGPCWKTFCFTNNGRILLQGEMDYLLLYDPKRARFAKLKVHRYLTRRSTAIHAYVPSLMPISSILGENVVAKKTSLIEAILAAPAPSDFAPSNVYSREFSSCFSFALSRILCLFLPKFLFSWAYHHLVPKKWLFHWWICAT